MKSKLGQRLYITFWRVRMRWDNIRLNCWFVSGIGDIWERVTDLLVKDKCPCRPFYDAIDDEDVERIRELAGTYPKHEPWDGGAISRVMYYSRPVQLDVLNALLDAGIDADERGSCGSTALMSTAARGSLHLPAARLLVERGADVNARNEDYETPFSYACAYEHIEMAKFLLSAGADPNPIHRAGGTPLDGIPNSDPNDIVRRFLLSIGAKREADL